MSVQDFPLPLEEGMQDLGIDRSLKLFWEGLKDRQQEVPKGGKWLRRHLSFLGNFCLHLRDISALRQCKKSIKTQSPTWPTGPLVSRSPCIPHYAVFLFSSLQIKSFLHLLLESTGAFILRVGSRTLSTWNSWACHLCIIFGDAWRDKPSPEVGIGCAKLGKAA
jgi:hypothetical protein